MLQIETSRGNIYYSEELIKNIVAISAIECSGVVGMANRNVKEGIGEILKNNNINNGVKISFADKKININVFVIVKYGIKVSVIANDVIQKIKYSIENYVGIVVNSITVNIQGIRVES